MRQLCSSTLLQFLLDYPLGDKRFQAHMHKLVANLSYEHESGRLAGIDFLAVLTSKLPPGLLRQYADVIFLPLVARLVGDASAKCRQEVGGAIATLLKVNVRCIARCSLKFGLQYSLVSAVRVWLMNEGAQMYDEERYGRPWSGLEQQKPYASHLEDDWYMHFTLIALDCCGSLVEHLNHSFRVPQAQLMMPMDAAQSSPLLTWGHQKRLQVYR